MIKQKIRVRLGEKLGSLFEDDICIQISPSWASEIARVFKERALHVEGYSSQGFERQKADFFALAYNKWRKTRDKLDKGEWYV